MAEQINVPEQRQTEAEKRQINAILVAAKLQGFIFPNIHYLGLYKGYLLIGVKKKNYYYIYKDGKSDARKMPSTISDPIDVLKRAVDNDAFIWDKTQAVPQ